VDRTVAVGDRAGVSSSPNAIAVSDGATWVANNASAVLRIGAGANVSRIDVGNDPRGIATGDRATWVADDFDGTVSRIDATGAVTAVTSSRESRGRGPLDIYPLGGPNLSEARRLAGRVHAHATMYTCSIAPQCVEDAHIVQADLAKIGITVHITSLPGAELSTRLGKRGDPWDIAWSNWGADFADPFTMLNELFDPALGFNFGRFNNPALTARMRHVASLSGERRLQAYGRLDEDLTRNNAPVAAWGIGTFREFFSARVGCQIYQPIYGFDLGSVCLRP
jgi:hypothetical protein